MTRLHAAASFAVALAGCSPPALERHPMPGADPERGQAVIDRVGCGACHQIPGVGWPEGTVGPPLEGFADRALIAGRFPNAPETLAGYVRNAPAYTPEGGMPSMPITEQEARDVAAYLYTLAR